ncbi:MAG: hypothetical protein QXL78_03145 [Methanocellales archaeon]
MAEEKKVLKLTLKKPEAAPAAPTPAPAPTPAVRPTVAAPAPAVAAPAAGGVIKLILQNAKIHIDQVIIKREEKK